MEKVKNGLLETLGELNEMLELSESLGLKIQVGKIGNMVQSVSDAITAIDKIDTEYLRVNDGAFHAEFPEFYTLKTEKMMFFTKEDVETLYNMGGYIYIITSDGKKEVLQKDLILESFNE